MAINAKKEAISAFISDTVITAKIKAKLTAQGSLNAIGVHIETYDGVVTLRGEVPNNIIKKTAIRTAQDTEGVIGVISQLDTEE